MIHLVENSQQLTTISDMVTMATYTIRVLAFNARGDGPLSNPIHVKMQQGGKIGGIWLDMVEHGGSRLVMVGHGGTWNGMWRHVETQLQWLWSIGGSHTSQDMTSMSCNPNLAVYTQGLAGIGFMYVLN